MRTLISVLPFLLFAGCSTPPPPPAPTPAPKITQFYASPAMVPTGEPALLCYGVESAASVTLDPGGESLSPALSRCIEKTLSGDTTFTLTAKGKDGATATQQVSVTTGVARLKFADLVVSAPQVKSGEPVSFCFKAQGAVSVAGGPGRFQKGGQASGDCLIDTPKKTTTYKLTIRGAGGQSDSESMTVKVIP